MSGGSFNYLCYMDAEILMRSGLQDARDMGDELAALGYAPDAARDTFAVVAEAQAGTGGIDAHLERLHPVWRAMEWWQSGDGSEQQFKRALAEYRGVDLPTCARCGGSGIEPGERYLACQNSGCANGKDTASLTDSPA